MDDKQHDVMFPHSFKNHLKSDTTTTTDNNNVFSQESSKQKIINNNSNNYPSVDGLPKYLQTNHLQFITKNVLKSMMGHKLASPFLRPVDKKTYTDYYDIIKRPMDLSYIRKKLVGKHYQSATDCIADFKQMFDNCDTYNDGKNDPEILNMNAELRKHFYGKVAKMPGKEQPLTLKSKTPKKNPRISLSGSMNGSNYDISSDDDDASHRSGFGIDEHLDSPPPAFNFQERRMEESISMESEVKKSLKRKMDGQVSGGNVSPTKSQSKGSSSRQLPKRPVKDFKLPENAGQDIEIGEVPANISRELGFCFEILREFYRKPLSARTSRYYQLESKIGAGDDEEDGVARKLMFMDLNTILKKFKQNDYQDVDEFAADVRKIFTFIYRFSKNSAWLVKETQEVQNIFELKFANIPYIRIRHQSSFNIKIDSLIKVVKNIGFQLESLKDKEPPLKRRRVCNDSTDVSSFQNQPIVSRVPQKLKPKPRASAIPSSVTQPPNKSSPKPQQPNKSSPKTQPPNKSSPKSQPPNKSSPKTQAPNKSSPKTQPQLQKSTPQIGSEIPREFAPFVRPNAKEQEMSRDDMCKLSFVISQITGEKMIFLKKLVHYLDPINDLHEEYVLDIENMKLSSLRAMERYVISCVGFEEYIQTTGRFIQDGDANTSSSSATSSSSSSSSSSSASSLSSESARQANTMVTNSTTTKPSLQSSTSEHTRSLNGDSSRKSTQGSSHPVASNKQGAVTNLQSNSSKSSESSRLPQKQESTLAETLNATIEDDAHKSERPPPKSSPEDENKNTDLLAERIAADEKQNQSKDSGVTSNEHAGAEENKHEGGARFPAWGLMLQKSKASAPQKPNINPDETFFKFKKQAEEKMEREKLSKQHEEDRRHRMELENDERLKKEKELKQAQEEEEALFGALGKTKPPEPQPSSSRSAPATVVAAPTTSSRPASPKNDNQQQPAVLTPSERRLIEQQRRKNAARACQIDLNAQSEIFAQFERDLHGQSLMNH